MGQQESKMCPSKLQEILEAVETRKMGREDASGSIEGIDPSHAYQVQPRPCVLLHVRVVCGKNITKGWVADLLDKPDPYVLMRIPTAPDGVKRTRHITDNKNPVWDESFTFLLDYKLNNLMYIFLMEANYVYDETLGEVTFDISELDLNKTELKKFTFNKGSQVHMEMRMEFDTNPTLRYSLLLSKDEVEYRKRRIKNIMEKMQQLLGDQGPQTLDEVPVISILGSGGGFRAMNAYSGCMNALYDTGLFDCAMYTAGLSGSSWYLAHLYSHPEFPNKHPREIHDEAKDNQRQSILRFVRPAYLYHFVDEMLKKRRAGQPISFTDCFGLMLRDTLLPSRPTVKLSDQRKLLKDAGVPLPLYTCVHVKKDVSAQDFQEWVEFSPYEIGMAKYGIFMDTELFASKFFLGKLVRTFDEQPLHYLMGIWGSAFTVLFQRLLSGNAPTKAPKGSLREELGRELDLEKDMEEEDASDLSDIDEEEEEDKEETDTFDENNSHLSVEVQKNPNLKTGLKRRGTLAGKNPIPKLSVRFADQTNAKPSPKNQNQDTLKVDPPRKSQLKFGRRAKNSQSSSTTDSPKGSPVVGRKVPKSGSNTQLAPQDNTKPSMQRQQTTKQKGFWENVVTEMVNSNTLTMLSTRAGRAGVVHSPLRGLFFTERNHMNRKRLATVKSKDEFRSIFEKTDTTSKCMYVVDAGLTFNSPFPLILRPQRGTDIILSFDFTGRPADDANPLEELLLAEKWASLNGVKFPPIDKDIYKREGMKTLYIFKHPNDPYCPIVFHFVLINLDFKEFKAPGVPRETPEEKEFGNFSVYEDPQNPYSTFNFTYTPLAVDRIAKLMEYNTLCHLDEIKDAIADCIKKKRAAAGEVSSRRAPLLKMRPSIYMNEMKQYIRSVERRASRKRKDSVKVKNSYEWSSVASDADTDILVESGASLDSISEADVPDGEGENEDDDADEFEDALDNASWLQPKPTVYHSAAMDYFKPKSEEEIFV